MKEMQCNQQRSLWGKMSRRLAAVLLAATVLLAMPALWAHHGLAAFDTTHTVKMEGTITSVEWINPHAFIYCDIKDANGKVANWKLELGSLGMLTKYGGWTETTVKRGDHVTVQGFVAKDGSPALHRSSPRPSETMPAASIACSSPKLSSATTWSSTVSYTHLTLPTNREV